MGCPAEEYQAKERQQKTNTTKDTSTAIRETDWSATLFAKLTSAKSRTPPVPSTNASDVLTAGTKRKYTYLGEDAQMHSRLVHITSKLKLATVDQKWEQALPANR